MGRLAGDPPRGLPARFHQRSGCNLANSPTPDHDSASNGGAPSQSLPLGPAIVTRRAGTPWRPGAPAAAGGGIERGRGEPRGPLSSPSWHGGNARIRNLGNVSTASSTPSPAKHHQRAAIKYPSAAPIVPPLFSLGLDLPPRPLAEVTCCIGLYDGSGMTLDIREA
jgi:hypothetical protein